MFFIIAVVATVLLVAYAVTYKKVTKGVGKYDVSGWWFAGFIVLWGFVLFFSLGTAGNLMGHTTPEIQSDMCVVDTQKWEDQAGMITLCQGTELVYDRWFIAPWLPKVEYTQWDWVKVPDTGQAQPWTHIQWESSGS